MKNLIFISLFIAVQILISQDKKIEQIYHTVCQRAGIETLKPLDFQPLNTGKCGFGLYVEIYRNREKFNDFQKSNIKKALQRPILQTSILSPSGRFRIHFDTTGVNEPFLIDTLGNKIPNSWKDYVDSLAKFIDHVYEVEVNELGFEFNFSDGGEGGGDEYDIYIQNLPENLYGETVFNYDSPLPKVGKAPRFISYIRVDNSYSESSYFTQGFNALKVTLAHEFHHAIQLLSYGLWEEDIWFYEMTSTWMEEVVYDEVNDYYFYLHTYFSRPNESLWLHNGYDLAILGIFFQKKFTHRLILKAWENIRNNPPLLSLEIASNIFGTSLRREFVEFSLWNFYTGKRANPQFYPESANYPEIRFQALPVLLSTNEAKVSNSATALSSQYYMFIWRNDTIVAIISNVNIEYALQKSLDEFEFQYHITAGNTDNSYLRLGNGLKAKLIASDFDNWGNLNILNKNLLAQFTDNPFPNPFYADGIEKIFIPVENGAGEVELRIFTSGLDLVAVKKLNPVIWLGNYFVAWDGRDEKGELVKTGVYIYAVKEGRSEKIGKFVVIRK